MSMRAPLTLKFVGLVLGLVVAAPAPAATGPRLEGTRTQTVSAVMVDPTYATSVPVARGQLWVTAGRARMVSDLRQRGTALTLEGRGLAPMTRYQLVAGDQPLVPFTTDVTGSVFARYLAGPTVTGWQRLPEVARGRLEGAPVLLRAVRVADAGRSEGTGASAAKDDPGQTATYGETTLCDPDGAPMGQVWVYEVEGYSYLAALGFGLEPQTEVTLVANGVPVGAVATDDHGFLFVDADAGEPLPGMADAMFDLPAALLPVTVVAQVELIAGSGVVVLAGDFTDPCVDQPPLPVAAGSVMLCDPDGGGGNPTSWRSGAFDWLELDGGLQMAVLWAFGLEPGSSVTVTLDGFEVGAFAVDAGGSLMLTFSTEPGSGELPLPPEVLPLSELLEVTLATGGQTVLAGTAGVPCDTPPAPVDRGDTPLCPAEGWSRGGWASWQTWDSGDEDLSVWTWGLEPSASYQVTVDGVVLGTFAADDWGSLGLTFASYDGPGLLPLPATVRPVSAVDDVTVTLADATVLAGSFSEPCQPPPPPAPVEHGITPLCPVDGLPGWGDAAWEVWDDGTERMTVWAYWDGLEPGVEVHLVVDGHDLGAFTQEGWGQGLGSLYLVFSSNPLPGELPLPAAVRPVSGVDVVDLVVEGEVLLHGSFADPCGPPPPPTPVDSGSTRLCAEQLVLAEGDMLWTTYDNGLEELFMSAWGLEDGVTYTLTVDGVMLGAFTPEGGYLFLAFSSEPQWPGQLPIPPELEPVSGIDRVELRDSAGVLLLAGSFTDPCTSVVQWEGNATALCSADGGMHGMASWWSASIGSEVLQEQLDVIVWEAVSEVTLTVLVDGLPVGALEPMPGWPETLALSLGTSSAAPIPPELRPLSGVDVVSVVEAGSATLLEGSFSVPCGVHPLAGHAVTYQRPRPGHRGRVGPPSGRLLVVPR